MTASVRRNVCGAGPGPCGKPNARFYPFGWRAECHAPAPAVTGKPTPLVIAVRMDVCVCGGPLLSPVDGPTSACPDCQEAAA